MPHEVLSDLLADPVLKEPNRRGVAQRGVAATPVVEHLDSLEEIACASARVA